MDNNMTEGEIKFCCATFYQSDLARMRLGDIFHPGGYELTHTLGEAIGLSSNDDVLDIACGRGHSAVYLAQNFGCRVTGLDLGAGNIATAHELAKEKGVSSLITFRQGDAEGIPFENGSFDAIISECSFCTFPNKNAAAAEMARLLRPGGRLGLTDMTVNGPLPQDIQNILSWVACVAGAGSSHDHVNILQFAGLKSFVIQDYRGALLDLVRTLRRKLLALELAINLKKIDMGNLDIDEGKRLARRSLELIEAGSKGYMLIIASV